jgi:hypothetical protein
MGSDRTSPKENIMAVGALTVTEKRTAVSAKVTGDNAIYTRTVTFTPDGGTAGAANLTGFIIPKDTLIMGGTIKFSVAQGGTCTWKFSVATDGDFCTASGSDAAYNVATRVPLKTPIQVVTTDDRQVTYTTAAAVNVACTAELTLILCAVGSVTGRAASVGV